MFSWSLAGCAGNEALQDLDRTAEPSSLLLCEQRKIILVI
jgi:hypothetical protein